jgi:DUF4097 and DUF4098 domain-containing protein YvlB
MMMKNRLCFISAFACVLWAAWTVTGDSWAHSEESQYFEEIYPVSERGAQVSLENVNGDVRVEVWDQAEVRVRAEKFASSQELLDELEIKIIASQDSVRVDTHSPDHRFFFGWLSSGRNGHYRVEYTLTVPRDAELDSIELVNGDLVVIGVQGGMQAELVNGDIITKDIGGDLRLSTVNGSISPEFEDMENVERIELESVNGKIRLILPSAASASVRVETVNGSLRNDFGLEVHKHEYVGADMRGEIGGADVDVRIETVNGGVEIRRGDRAK